MLPLFHQKGEIIMTQHRNLTACSDTLEDMLCNPLNDLLPVSKDEHTLWEQLLRQCQSALQEPVPVVVTTYGDLLATLQRLTTARGSENLYSEQTFPVFDKLLHRIARAASEHIGPLRQLSLRDYFNGSLQIGGGGTPLWYYQGLFRTATHDSACPTGSHTVRNVLEYLTLNYSLYTHQDRLRQDDLLLTLLLTPLCTRPLCQQACGA